MSGSGGKDEGGGGEGEGGGGEGVGSGGEGVGGDGVLAEVLQRAAPLKLSRNALTEPPACQKQRAHCRLLGGWPVPPTSQDAQSSAYLQQPATPCAWHRATHSARLAAQLTVFPPHDATDATWPSLD